MGVLKDGCICVLKGCRVLVLGVGRMDLRVAGQQVEDPARNEAGYAYLVLAGSCAGM